MDTRPLRIAPFRRLLTGQGTAFIGSMFTQVAVPVQVYAISHSSLLVGLVGGVGLVPIVVFGLWGGAVADVVDRRALYLWSSVGAWLVTVGLLAQTLAGMSSVGLMLGLVFAQSGLFAISSSTRGAIVPRLVPLELVPASNALFQTVGNVGNVVGLLAAGVLVALPHGFAYAYTVDAVLFFAALYAGFRLPPLPAEGPTELPGLRSVVEGLAFISRRPVLVMSFGVDIVAMVLAMPWSLFPAVAHARFHGTIGPLYASIAIGGLLVGLTSGWIGRVRRQGVAITAAIVCWGGFVALAGLAHQLWLVVVLLALAGGADLISAVFRQTILQSYAPDEMRGRMQGVFTAVVSGGPRLGYLRAGVVASVAGTTFSWVSGGIACMIVVVVAAVAVRPFWNYDARARRRGVGDAAGEDPGEDAGEDPAPATAEGAAPVVAEAWITGAATADGPDAADR
ncbi:MAG: MFS transporter [Actinomycetia bacterium]|nr:MFS transporter [Actinomycetes bacterium]